MKHDLTDVNTSNYSKLDKSNKPMTQYHPDSHWLTEYVAGSLSESQALCVSTHLSYCSHCREEVARLNDVGAMIFEDQPPSASLDAAMFNRVMDRIANPAPQFEMFESGAAARSASGNVSRSLPSGEKLPSAIGKLMGREPENLRWKKIGKYIRVAALDKLDEQREIALHKLLPGGAVAEHDHHGEEITVVLCGSFSDQDGVYKAGDFIIRQPGDTHRPIVTDHEECICLSVCEAPVKFTGMFTRLLNPLVAYQHKH